MVTLEIAPGWMSYNEIASYIIPFTSIHVKKMQLTSILLISHSTSLLTDQFNSHVALSVLVVTSSVFFLTIIAAERFFSIVYPLKARFTRPSVHLAIILFTWAASAAVAWPNLYTRQLNSIKWKDYDQRYCAEVWPRVIKGPDPENPFICLYIYPSRRLYYILQVTVLYFLPILIMAIVYAVIVYTLYKRKVPGNESDIVRQLQARTRKKVRLVQHLLLMTKCVMDLSMD